MQETLARHGLHAETLAGLAILLGSCFRRNDEYWFFAQSPLRETSMDKLMPPLVARIRQQVKAFRDGGYSGASDISRSLLN